MIHVKRPPPDPKLFERVAAEENARKRSLDVVVCSQNLVMLCNQQFESWRSWLVWAWYKGEFMLEFVLSFACALRVFFRSRSDVALEVLALRQQLAVLKRKRPRPKLNRSDRIFWTMLRHV